MRKLPSFVGTPYPFDRYLGFSSTSAVESPHFLSSLSSTEKIRLNRSGMVPMKCQEILDKNGAKDLTENLLQDIDSNKELSFLMEPTAEIHAHMSYGCEFLGSPGAYSFFYWSDPKSILVNRDGSSQIDWHRMCADAGLDLRQWRWSTTLGKAVPARAGNCGVAAGDVIAKCLENASGRNGEAVIELLMQITHDDFEQELLHMHLSHCSSGSSTLRHLCRDYVNHGFIPEDKSSRHTRLKNAVGAATKAFCEASSDPQAQAENRALFESMLAPKTPTQLILVSRELGALLSKHGATVVSWGSESLWCRYSREAARKDRDLEAVLVYEFPDLMDDVIEEAMPDVARSLREKISKPKQAANSEHGKNRTLKAA